MHDNYIGNGSNNANGFQIDLALLSRIQPNSFEEANKDEFWNKAMNLQRICRMNLKFHYLENYPSFWVFKYVKETKEFLFLKLSISEKC